MHTPTHTQSTHTCTHMDRNTGMHTHTYMHIQIHTPIPWLNCLKTIHCLISAYRASQHLNLICLIDAHSCRSPMNACTRYLTHARSIISKHFFSSLVVKHWTCFSGSGFDPAEEIKALSSHLPAQTQTHTHIHTHTHNHIHKTHKIYFFH